MLALITGYWQKERWNRYALVCYGYPTTYFTNYEALERYAKRRGINAVQV